MVVVTVVTFADLAGAAGMVVVGGGESVKNFSVVACRSW